MQELIASNQALARRAWIFKNDSLRELDTPGSEITNTLWKELILAKSSIKIFDSTLWDAFKEMTTYIAASKLWHRKVYPSSQ